MPRKWQSTKAAPKEMMVNYLKNHGISPKNVTDINAIIRIIRSVILEEVLGEEPDKGFGYCKYDYRSKSQNGHPLSCPQ